MTCDRLLNVVKLVQEGGTLMKDFPIFITEYGVASLVLREVPYTKRAYITLQSTLQGDELLKECLDFCVAVGAEEVFACGHECLDVYPFHTAIWKMQCLRESLSDTDAALWPVDEKTMEKWRSIYNEKSFRIPNGAWLSEKECKKLLEENDGYFVHRQGVLLGTGLIGDGELLWVASVQKAAGADVVRALAHGTFEDEITLTVASENHKAVALYRDLGFLCVEESKRWYRIK